MSGYVSKGDCEIEVLARSSKNGTIGQNTLYSGASAREARQRSTMGKKNW